MSNTNLNDDFKTVCLTQDWQKITRFAVETVGLTERELAVELEVAVSTVKRWLKNETKPLDFLKLEMLEQIETMIILKTTPPPVERGSWSVVFYGNRVDVQSDDFTHDAALTVTCDFKSQNEKIAYAREIAKRLNEAKGVISI